jgi:hypothetical protein
MVAGPESPLILGREDSFFHKEKPPFLEKTTLNGAIRRISADLDLWIQTGESAKFRQQNGLRAGNNFR